MEDVGRKSASPIIMVDGDWRHVLNLNTVKVFLNR
jgi:hypothetical protein